MTDKETAIEQLNHLKLGISDWERYQRTCSLNKLNTNRDTQNMVMHALLVAIQAAIDVAHHVIAHLQLPKPTSYRDSFKVLSSYGYLEEDLAEKMADLASFRNVLVHVYWRTDLERVFEILKTRLDTVVEFTATIEPLLKDE